jgi:Tfp pilus assembly protein PilF
VALDPERTDAYIWLGVLYEATGDADRARTNFERARALFDEDDSGEVYFRFQRGSLYLAFNDTAAAEQDALTAMEEAPDRPEGFFLLGNVAERTGDLQLAAAAFQQAAALAAATGEDALRATALIRFASISEMLMTMPEQEN